ncbi:2-iminoacetate synthase [Tetrabaena socialis]|uniref:2-iminoacetate synthase n=1 Tax=Tetrabaena socialis TaxID=47790 RepID=A0A2J8AE63_9CHLO|nr:2-iminoacetate synthase [Tetrabaena socialis]|eukprot:PNH10803.1 2-iminoacetate synthase [Tetrabaena socialis]
MLQGRLPSSARRAGCPSRLPAGMARRLPVARYAPGSKVPHLWSVERETHHTYRDPAEFIDEAKIFKALEATKEHAKDAGRVRDILAKAKQNAFVGHSPNVPDKQSEFVQGLNLEECATLLNVDSDNVTLMNDIFDTALAIKNRIYGNRVVLFAPLYIANHCVNSCTYCAFRAANKGMERSILTDDDLREEVAALQLQGHRRILALTGESPKYSFEQFLHALQVITSVTTEPCGSIRRINVEIPPLSVSDMRRLKATDTVGTFVLFQESYHRDTFKTMHPTGPKSDFDYRVLTQDRAMRAGLDDVGIGALFGLFDYRYEVCAMLMHAEHLEREYHAGPHTISVPRMRPADGSELSISPPYPVNDADFKKLQPWKLLTRFLLAAAAPAGTTGWGWVYSTAPLPQPGGPLSDRLLAAAQAHRHCRPGRLPLPPDVDGRALLCEPLFYNPLILDAAQEPLVPPPGWPADGPTSLGQWRQLAATPGAGQQPDGLDVVAGALPAAWQALLADPVHTPLPPWLGWRVEPGGGRARCPDGVVHSILASGRLVAAPVVGPLPGEGEGWAPACVLAGRKPRRLWSLEERETYEAAAPHERAGAWPREPLFLDAWTALHCFPLSHGHGKLSVVDYEEYLSDYADPDLRAKGEAVIAQEMGEHASEPLSAQALKRLERKMKLVKEGQHDVYI